MAFEARVLLKRPRHELPVDIGVKQVEQRPIRFGKTTFTHEGHGALRLGPIRDLHHFLAAHGTPPTQEP
jgi:hypothetical protein